MPVLLQRVGCAEHEDGGVHPDYGLLHPDQAGVEHIAHDNDDTGHDRHRQRQPGGSLAGEDLEPFEPPVLLLARCH